MKTTAVNKLASLCALLLATTLVLLPFHAFATVWLSSALGHYTLFRLWIEIVLAVLVPLAFTALRTSPAVRKAWHGQMLVWLCGWYVLWQMLLGLWAWHQGWVNRSALLDGLATDLRFIAFFLVAWAVSAARPWLAAKWQQLVLLPAGIVTAIGVLQATIWPHDVLRHFGYGPQTIPAYETVDQNQAYVRLQSTLRGPNPLGAYLVLPITATAALIACLWRQRRWLVQGLFLAASGVVLALTYSRSAYIGTALSLGVLCWLLLTARGKRWLLLAAAVLIVIFSGLTAVLRHNSGFENTFFHTTEHSSAQHSSNQDRASALRQGLHDVAHQPLGRGAGSAGPASAHNDHPARIAENYYLQIGQESGWLGLGLFLAINIGVAVRLWRQHNNQLAVVLLASFVGLSCINMLSHAWADDTLGMLWWGLAGIALGSLSRNTEATT